MEKNVDPQVKKKILLSITIKYKRSITHVLIPNMPELDGYFCNLADNVEKY